MSMKIVLALIGVLLSVSPAVSDMYRWVDKNGVVTFKDTPPPRKQKKVKVYSDGDFDPAPYPGSSGGTRPSTSATRQKTASHVAPQDAGFHGTVEIYTTSWCRYCKEALIYLNSKNIPYVNYDIEKDGSAKQRYKELGGSGVPFIVAGSHKMSGFSVDWLESALHSSN